MIPLPADDLEAVAQSTLVPWRDLRGARIFLTGGTGFWGRWLLETFAHANAHFDLGAHTTVLTRDAAGFQEQMPHLATLDCIGFQSGDVRDFSFSSDKFSHIIHAATPASAQLNAQQPLEMFDTIVSGTRHVLQFALHCSAQRFLLASSGAIYGTQPSDIGHLSEAFAGAPCLDDAMAAYAHGKRAAEWMCGLHAKEFEVTIARGWAFVGPHLPLDIHFAIGNFLRDALGGRDIQLSGDGTPRRSYLYASDMTIWLWAILLRGQNGRAYNVGSEHDFSLYEVAQVVAAAVEPHSKVLLGAVPNPQVAPSRYVPSTQRAQNELGLRQTVDLPTAVARTLRWYRHCDHRHHDHRHHDH